jgi:aryl-alcohol dehydrogenase-like predicted oxidoreductase
MNANKLILGTVQFGLNYGINNPNGKPTEKKVFDILNYALDQNIGILDTAEAYGNSQEIIGNYLKQKPGSFAINTKFRAEGGSLSNQLETTLQQLHTSSVHVYFFHHFNDFIQHPELFDQLKKLKIEGKIAKIGLSVYENEEFLQAANSDLIDVIQFPYNLLDNEKQRGEIIKQAKANGKELQVRSVFLQGLFFKSMSDLSPKLQPLSPYLQKIKEITERSHTTIQQLALQYALQHSQLDNVIIGVDSDLQLQNNIAVMQSAIAREAIQAIDQIDVKEKMLLYPKNW